VVSVRPPTSVRLQGIELVRRRALVLDAAPVHGSLRAGRRRRRLKALLDGHRCFCRRLRAGRGSERLCRLVPARAARSCILLRHCLVHVPARAHYVHSLDTQQVRHCVAASPTHPVAAVRARVLRGPSASAVPANQRVPARCLCSALGACALLASLTGPACLKCCLTCQPRVHGLPSDAGLQCQVFYYVIAYAPARVTTGRRRRPSAPHGARHPRAAAAGPEPAGARPDSFRQLQSAALPAPRRRAASAGSGRRALPRGERGAQAPAPAERRRRAVRRALWHASRCPDVRGRFSQPVKCARAGARARRAPWSRSRWSTTRAPGARPTGPGASASGRWS